jgi:eukaryotic-like serine/threonine-protein kinase
MPELDLPTTIRGRYRLDEVIGAGGFAVVYRGKDLMLERPVAVKVVPNAATDDRQPFAREIAALSPLSHPGIVRLFDGGRAGALAYLVMELVEGKALDAALAAHAPLPPTAVRALGHQSAEALAHAHAAGRVHRDVKPANLLLDGSGRVHLTDFGVARVLGGTATLTVSTLGTAAYLAPEQVRGASVGPPADVYSLGLVLLECLTGARPFPGPPAEAAVARLQRDPAIPAGLPEPWTTLLAAMTAREPADRPPAAVVARRLRPRASEAATAGLGALATGNGRPAARATWPRRPRAVGRGRGRRPAGVLLATLVVGLVSLTGWLLLDSAAYEDGASGATVSEDIETGPLEATAGGAPAAETPENDGADPTGARAAAPVADDRREGHRVSEADRGASKAADRPTGEPRGRAHGHDREPPTGARGGEPADGAAGGGGTADGRGGGPAREGNAGAGNGGGAGGSGGTGGNRSNGGGSGNGNGGAPGDRG